jgi:excisionase family DNA binding protein
VTPGGAMSDLSPKDVAATLGLSRSALDRLIEDGELRPYKRRGRVRAEPTMVRAPKERNRVNPRRQPEPPMYEPVGLLSGSRGCMSADERCGPDRAETA